MAAQTLLLIEDDPDISELIQYNLEKNGFKVLVAEDGEEGLHKAETKKPSLILLDLMLPGMDGLEVCRKLKQGEQTRGIPVIMVTAKGEEPDIVIGLEMGADDYVTKPFSPRELVARIRALLRRAGAGVLQPSGNKAESGPLSVDPDRHEVRLRGKVMALTLAEFRLLQALVSAPGRVFTRDQLLDRITGGEAVIVDRNVDVHIRALRKALGKSRALIETVRGLGYRLKG